MHVNIIFITMPLLYYDAAFNAFSILLRNNTIHQMESNNHRPIHFFELFANNTIMNELETVSRRPNITMS